MRKLTKILETFIRMPSMGEQTLENKLLDLFDGINRFLELEMKVIDEIRIGNKDRRCEDLQETIKILQYVIDSLRLFSRYVFFDLEITREEKR